MTEEDIAAARARLAETRGTERKLSREQEERREVLLNDIKVHEQTEKDTHFSRAQADVELENQGRFKKQTETEVIASKPQVRYPAQPASSPFAHDPAPPENPLGYDINALEPVGERHEIEVAGPPIERPAVAVPFRKRV
jgi:hypothetical protein